MNKKPNPNRHEIHDFVDALELKEPDKRDFSLAGVFGAIDIGLVPNADWLAVGPIRIKNQRSTDMCTGMALAAVREDQEGVELSPEWLFAQIKKIRKEYLGYGGDLGSGVKAALKVGAIKQADAPFSIENKDRNFLANWNNWPVTMYDKAIEHKAESSFRVDGPYDTFDNIRAALWANRAENRSIYTGGMWRPGWSGSGGVLPDTAISGGVGHAFKILCGGKMINGKPYLMIQNSGGEHIGDKGVFYMSRAVANRELKFGCYMFKDMPRDVAEDLNKKHLEGLENKTFFSELMALIRKYIK